ncbi:hypothetical protein P154DRAFT_362980 [Amniculicola lignicola CBS 123094]|uniref:Uncharacterized protein n=1 Tax=Amniculicola lignicola CBS 123094 TaxID=1392246 RepID=A0A6A5VZG0_9PLEO|nr:hypothetical protein P154DRAFT_362980 [Amniculicola lignicola CBS 123094]
MIKSSQSWGGPYVRTFPGLDIHRAKPIQHSGSSPFTNSSTPSLYPCRHPPIHQPVLRPFTYAQPTPPDQRVHPTHPPMDFSSIGTYTDHRRDTAQCIADTIMTPRSITPKNHDQYIRILRQP